LHRFRRSKPDCFVPKCFANEMDMPGFSNHQNRSVSFARKQHNAQRRQLDHGMLKSKTSLRRKMLLRRLMIPVVAVAATICVFATCLFGTQMIVAPTTLAGAYNVPYFSTFLVPDIDSSGTPGGLHQAAASYKSLLRSKGVIDDDGEHYLNPSQVTIFLQHSCTSCRN